MVDRTSHNLQSISCCDNLFAVTVGFDDILGFIGSKSMPQYVFTQVIAAHESL